VKRLNTALVLLPAMIILMMIQLDIHIKNPDALTYHLYYARVISEYHLNFFSDRPVPLANELGFGLSSYYPWLYSHIVSLIQRLGATYDTSAYIFSGILYLLTTQCYEKFSSKIIIASYLMMPIILNYYFLSGTNYFLTSFLGFFIYKLSNQELTKINVIALLAVSFLLVNTHVFGIFICLLIFLHAFLKTQKNDYLILIILILLYQILHNFLLTGSPIFPYFQNIFPHRNFNAEEWAIVNSEIRNGIHWELEKQGSFIKFILIVMPTFLIGYCFSRKFIKLSDKILLVILLLPLLAIDFFGLRHRVIFQSIFLFVFLDLSEKENNPLTSNPIVMRLLYCLLAFSFLSSFSYVIREHSDQTLRRISIYGVKKCFYDEISKLSISNKILFTETELMRIQNPTNILPVDGKNYSEMRKLSSYEEFYVYLKDRKIKYITHTPLSSQQFYWAEKNAYDQYMPLLIKDSKIKIHKDCVSENLIDKTVSGHENKLYSNWLIYEVK